MTFNKDCPPNWWEKGVYATLEAIDKAVPGGLIGTYIGHEPTRGRAADFMCGIPWGQKLVAYLLPRMKQLNIWYIIHDGRIYSQTYPDLIMKGGKAYHPTAAAIKKNADSAFHRNHVHLSFYPGTTAPSQPNPIGVSSIAMYAAEDDVKGYSKAGKVLWTRAKGKKLVGSIQLGHGGEKYLVTPFGTWYPLARLTERNPLATPKEV